jgi:hypothetical protein
LIFGRISTSLEYDQPLGHIVALEGNRAGRLFFRVGITN